MAKRQICVQVDEEVAKRMEDIRDKTGIPISRPDRAQTQRLQRSSMMTNH